MDCARVLDHLLEHLLFHIPPMKVDNNGLRVRFHVLEEPFARLRHVLVDKRHVIEASNSHIFHSDFSIGDVWPLRLHHDCQFGLAWAVKRVVMLPRHLPRCMICEWLVDLR